MILKELKNIAKAEDRAKFLCEKGNRKELIAAKKEMFGIKSGGKKTSLNADYEVPLYKGSNIFGSSPVSLNDDEVFAVINSVGFMDSHLDVSMKGSWTKTIEERGQLLKALKDHSRKVDDIFAENLGAMVLELPINLLGFNAVGNTEVFGMKLKPEQAMLEMYQKNMVTEHSAGLQYVKIGLAINDEREEEGYKEWLANIDKVINREVAEQFGFFYPIYEQKAVEGSAVVFGSNSYTPAFTNKSLASKEEPLQNTQKEGEPVKGKGLEFLNSLVS